jgi:hypothetical protein
MGSSLGTQLTRLPNCQLYAPNRMRDAEHVTVTEYKFGYRGCYGYCWSPWQPLAVIMLLFRIGSDLGRDVGYADSFFLFVDIFSHFGKCPYITSIRSPTFPSKSFPIHRPYVHAI